MSNTHLWRRRAVVAAATTLTGTQLLGCNRAPRTTPPASSPDVNGSTRAGASSKDKLTLPLQQPDQHGIRLPKQFVSRIVATSGQRLPGAARYRWHPAPDGGSTYTTDDGGWIYVSNSEVDTGGAGALRFDSKGNVIDAYSILAGTKLNCAGGATPHQSWLSCEEYHDGLIYECDPWGVKTAIARPAMGVFAHEAAAFHPADGHYYLTEDIRRGALYRFRPTGDVVADPFGSPLGQGILQVAVVASDGAVAWHDVPDPSAQHSATAKQVPNTTIFAGGEGIVAIGDAIVFSTKYDNTIWSLDVRTQKLRMLFRDESKLSGVDNIWPFGQNKVLVAEDRPDGQRIVILDLRDATATTLLQLGPTHSGSEICGPALSPDGTRLYFSSQRGRDNNADRGLTLEVRGDFAALM